MDTSTHLGNIRDNIIGIRVGDALALVLASFVLSIPSVIELEEITLCQELRGRDFGGDRGRKGEIFECGRCCSTGSWIPLALQVLDWLRQYVLLPGVNMTVPFVVLHGGSDAMTVCFNTMAILFVLEIDNFAYTALSFETKSINLQRVNDLAPEKRAVLDFVKKAHIIMISSGVLFCLKRPVWLGGGDFCRADDPECTADRTMQWITAALPIFFEQGWTVFFGEKIVFPLFIVFLVGGILNSYMTSRINGDSPALQAAAIVLTFVKWCFGYLAWTMAQMSVFLMNHHLLRTHTGVYDSKDEWSACSEAEHERDLWGFDCHH